MKFSVRDMGEFNFVEFELDGPIEPSDLRSVIAPKINYTKGVVISGRGPIWLYGYLIHQYHPTPWVGVYDPRLGGGVVVASHAAGYPEGTIVPVES